MKIQIKNKRENKGCLRVIEFDLDALQVFHISSPSCAAELGNLFEIV